MTQKEFINLLVKNGTPKDNITVEDGLINVDGDVDIRFNYLFKIPHPFGIVTGDFSCSWNKLRTLDWAPSYVGGSFNCAYNKLTTLEGVPLVIGGNFHCGYNQLTTLEGGPKYIGGELYLGKYFLFPRYYYINIINIEKPKKVCYSINF